MALVCLFSILTNEALAFYNPQTGHWLTRDPVQESGGLNQYGFVANDPLDYTDSSGLALYAFDGTANVPRDQSNIYLTQASGYTGHNIRYEEGIGAEDEHSALVAILQQATGIGLSAKRDKMLQAMETYIDQGDTTVDVIGFSRGAVTAVTFAEAIEKLKKEGVSPYCKINHIQFMGLYDPVSGPGPFTPHPSGIPDIVDNISIAYSLDEKRQAFAPLVYSGTGINAMAFHGGHSDVGGGYSDRGLANISLEWMIDQGVAAGAPFRKYPTSPLSQKMIRHQENAWYSKKASRSNIGGVPLHPSVSRLIAVPEADNYEHAVNDYYLDKVAPGNDEYQAGEHKF